MSRKEIRALSATGMLGSGFREETLQRAMALKPDFIGADAGSTDPGPHHLGSGVSQFSDAACKRDLRLMLIAARAAKIPVIVGSAGTAGTDLQLERLVRTARDIAREDKLSFKLAAIRSEQDKGYLKRKLREGRIRPLANAPKLDAAVIDRSAHIVGMCGVEPYIEALQNGADVVIAGRSSDTSIFAALPMMKGCNPATVWHAAKILECGAACVVLRKYPDCMFATITDDSFVIEPPNPDYRCDPASVASHNLYENATPYRLIEPSGVLDTVAAKYEAVSDRAVRVSGSTFRHAGRYTVKLEGAELAGYQSLILGSVRDPIILRQLDSWLEGLIKAARDRIAAVFGAGIEARYQLDVRVFGRNSAMGPLESETRIGHEAGLLFQVTAQTQELATALAKSVGHIAVHYPVPEWTGLITSIAYPYSPAEIARGASYRFNMNHVVEPATPLEMFRIDYQET
ncbi:MAG: acyclic terpene utilization AtuA family protein [Betaproteobacteria bacterium]|nr:acyclic terpene utilization AtuA family protein [Betaproteobacteria bacterium]